MTRAELAQSALRGAIAMRKQAEVPTNCPVSPVDLATTLGLCVRFVDISMEGMYVSGNQPSIILSSLRPFARRNFTCGHELGHHHFGHGSTIDELNESAGKSQFQPEEFLVDAFSGFLLMPPIGMRQAFADRNISLARAGAYDILRVASAFGVGYDTLISQLSATKQLQPDHADRLRRVGLAGIRKELLGVETAQAIVVVDQQFEAKTLDLEVGMLVLLPSDVDVSGGLERIRAIGDRNLFEATSPGIGRLCSASRQWSVFARVARDRYVGLATYRHLEESDE